MRHGWLAAAALSAGCLAPSPHAATAPPREDVTTTGRPSKPWQWGPQCCLDSERASAAWLAEAKQAEKANAQMVGVGVRPHFREFQGCYELGLRRNPDLQGRVEIAFELEPDGHTQRAHVEKNDIPDCQVAACVRDVVARIAFPERPGARALKIAYAIRLESWRH